MLKSIIVPTILFSSHLFAQETIYNTGSFQMHEGAEMGCFGDFINDSALVENNGILFLTGNAGMQTFSGTGTFIFDSVSVNNSADILIEQELKIAENINFVLGNLVTNRDAIDSQYVHFLAGSDYTGVSDLSFIDGVAVKSGNTAFDFPIGDTDELRLLQISSPALITDQFKAFYLNNDPNSDYPVDSIDLTCLHHVSRCEYWILNRTAGSSAVLVGLSYAFTSCGIDIPCELLVARWDGAEWKNEGNGGVVGTMSSGIITTGDGCGDCGSPTAVSEFSPFTLGSSTLSNPLPITLIDFKVNQSESAVTLLWVTASETNNDYYTIERSQDGKNWRYLGTVEGAGNSSKTSNYELIDRDPLLGLSYYRLSQVDYDGTQKEIGIESVVFSANHAFQIQPNPASNSIQIYYNDGPPTTISIYTSGGQLVQEIAGVTEEGFISIDVKSIPPGVYFVHIRKDNELTVEKVILI